MKAVVFDMDGVLVDSERYWRQVESDFLKQLVPSWDEDLQQGILGLSARDVHAILAEKHGVALSYAEYISYYNNLAQDIYGTQVTMLPGVEEVIRKLVSRGLPIGLATSSPREWLRIVLSRFELEAFFKVALSSDDVDGKGKPDPAIYKMACASLGVAPENCLAIEDTDKGIASACGAGMKCVGVRNGMNQEQSLSCADLVIEGFEGLSLVEILEL